MLCYFCFIFKTTTKNASLTHDFLLNYGILVAPFKREQAANRTQASLRFVFGKGLLRKIRICSMHRDYRKLWCCKLETHCFRMTSEAGRGVSETLFLGAEIDLVSLSIFSKTSSTIFFIWIPCREEIARLKWPLKADYYIPPVTCFSCLQKKKRLHVR